MKISALWSMVAVSVLGVGCSEESGGIAAGISGATNDLTQLPAWVSLVSVSTTGTGGNARSMRPHFSRDGRCISFVTDATNMFLGDTDGRPNAVVRDRELRTNRRIFDSTSDGYVNSAVTYVNPALSTPCVGHLAISEPAPWNQSFISLSRPGMLWERVGRISTVTGPAFRGLTTSLTLGDEWNTYAYESNENIYLGPNPSKPWVAGREFRISNATTGGPGNGASTAPQISRDGNYVAYVSNASNLVVGGTNGQKHIFLYDRNYNATDLIDIAPSGALGNGESREVTVSNGGRFVAFSSTSSNLVTPDKNGVYDVFVRDRVYATTTLVSVGLDGFPSNARSGAPSISADGRYIAFISSASNLVPGDTNGAPDVFVYDTATRAISRQSLSASGAQANGGSESPAISPDGSMIAYVSSATNIVPNDSNWELDVYVTSRR